MYEYEYEVIQRSKERRAPSLMQPGLMPPTVAGPMMVTPRLAASLFMRRVRFSGMPSAIITTTRTCTNERTQCT